MGDEKKPASQPTLETIAESLARIEHVQRATSENVNRIAGTVTEHGVRLRGLEDRARRNSGFVAETRQSVSEANSELVQVKAAVVSAVANVEENARSHRAEVDRKLDAMAKTMTTVAVDTTRQNAVLAKQTEMAEDQTTALARVRKTPRLTAVATFVSIVLAELIRILLTNPPHLPH